MDSNALLVVSIITLLPVNAQKINIGLEQVVLIALQVNMIPLTIGVFVLQDNIGIIINVINVKIL